MCRFLSRITLVLCICPFVLAAPPTTKECEADRVIEHGRLECNVKCVLSCDYGYISGGRAMFDCDDPDIAEARCVRPMAMIVGGYENLFWKKSVELYASNGTFKDFQVAVFPYKIESPVGFWFNGEVLVCGGKNHEKNEYENRCWQYLPCNNSWVDAGIPTMAEQRGQASGVVRSSGQPWVLGGETDAVSSTSEILRETTNSSEWTSGPNLESAKYGHCAVSTANGKMVIVTGGYSSYKTVEWFNVDTGAHSVDTSLLHKRFNHVCSTFPEGDGEAILVAGGANELLIGTNTVEIYSPATGDWANGPILPLALSSAGMIILDGKPTLFGGQYMVSRKRIYSFEYENGAWTHLDHDMQEARASAGTFAVPETLFQQCADL